MNDRWYAGLALSRIGPDTGELARHIQVTAAGHLRGCLCPECSDLRRAVGGHRMDKYIAKTMAAKERGKVAAERGITAQRHREGAARAQVTRELADCGACPYRSSGSDWHEPGCGCGCENPGRRKVRPATGPVCQEAEPALPPDPVAQWQEVTRSLILPDYGQFLALVPDQPPGTCKDCRTGPLYAGNQCWYCNERGDLAITKPAQPDREHSRALLLLVMLLAGLLILWTALVLLLVLT